jgi:predicted molibdopterin-dependent oxidoreductase YjgC
VVRAKLAGARLIVIDARRHRVALHADHFLQLRPGTDVLLYGAMAKVIVDRGLMNRAFIKAQVSGFDALVEAVRQYDLLAAADRCGVPAEIIEAAALALARARAASILYATGAETRSAESIRGLVNLALLTGHLGREGAGVFALTEHNNLQGVCDMGMVPDRLPGYGRVEDPGARAPFERRWGVTLPSRPGADTREILAGGSTSTIRGAWLCRYDPMVTATFCDPTAALQNLDFLVVQQLFLTATAKLAHVVLPLTAFGEERVSFTSTDRRIQLAEQAIEPPAGPMPAWRQITLAAQALGADWDYATAGDVMDEIGTLVPFYSGASHENLAREYGRQWPCTKDRPLGTPRLFAEGTPHRPFRFAPVPRPTGPCCTTAEFPLALVFGHSLYYWHQNVLVQHSETLKREYRMLLLDYPEGFVEINPADASLLGLRDGQPMRVVSPRGVATTTARVTPEVRAGTVFVPFFVREVERQILDPCSDQTGAFSRPVCVRVEKA